MRRALLFAVVTSSCVANMLTPEDEITPEIRNEWAIAQEWLTSEPWNLDSQKVYGVRPEHFRWKTQREVFKCGDQPEAFGCYRSATGTIEWVESVPEVIRHEAGHAILHRLKDARWRCFMHTDDCYFGHSN